VTQPARIWAVYGRQHGRIKNVCVQVQPEAVNAVSLQVAQSSASGRGRPVSPQPCYLPHGDAQPMKLRQSPSLSRMPGTATSSSRTYGRRPVQVGQVRLTAPCDQSKVLAGRCPHAGRVAKVAEVRVPIQECQAVPSRAVERQRRPEHDAAVAAQHERESPRV